MNIYKGIKGLGKSFMNIGIAGKGIINERREICAGCPYRNEEFLSNWTRCNVCGCFIMHKTRLADECCPMNYWECADAVNYEVQEIE